MSINSESKMDENKPLSIYAEENIEAVGADKIQGVGTTDEIDDNTSNPLDEPKFEIEHINIEGFILSGPDDSDLDMKQNSEIPPQLTTGIPSSPAIYTRPADAAPTHTCQNDMLRSVSSDSLHLNGSDSEDLEYSDKECRSMNGQIPIDPDIIFDGVFPSSKKRNLNIDYDH